MRQTESRKRRQVASLQPAAVLFMLLVLLIGFALRAYHLDYQSLWTDEGQSLLRASVPLGRLAQATPNEHQPTYFALLHLWIDLTGSSDFALRYFALWPSVLAIALTYRLAADLGAARTGLVAGLLLATASFQVWYAQEARMYTWLLLTSLAATWLLWRLLTRWPGSGEIQNDDAHRHPPDPLFPRGRDFWLTFGGYIIATVFAIYLHHYGLVLLLAHTAFMLAWLVVTRGWRAFLRWALAGCTVILLLVPAIPRFFAMLNYAGWQQNEFGATELPWRFLAAYVAGPTMPDLWRDRVTGIYGVLLLAGLYSWWRTNRMGALLLVACAITPVCAAWALALNWSQFHERYTIMATAPLLLLAAHSLEFLRPGFWARQHHKGPDEGVTGQGRGQASRRLLGVVAAAVLAALVGANAVALNRLYHDEAVQKADYRAAAAFIQDREIPGDVIIADDPWLEDSFMRYYRGTSPIRDLFQRHGPEQSQLQWFSAAKAAAGEAPRVWLVEHHGSTDFIQHWLDQTAWLAGRIEYKDIYLSLYGLAAPPQSELPLRSVFGSELELTGFGLSGSSQVGGQTIFRAGDLINLSSSWKVLRTITPLTFSLRLIDLAGRVWHTRDYVPEATSQSAGKWQAGQTLVDRGGIWLGPDLPPGDYEISLAVHDAKTKEVLRAGDQQSVTLSRITLLARATSAQASTLPMGTRLDRAVGEDLDLLGYTVVPSPLQPETGGTLHVWWRARRPPAKAYQVQIELLSRGGESIARSVQPLSLCPANSWQEGQIVHEQYAVALDPIALSGDYRLRLSLAGANEAVTGPTVVAGRVRVEARSRSYAVPRTQHPLQLKLGQAIALRGYTLESPKTAGDELRLTLYWQALQRIPEQYKVFVHLVDEDGQIAAQADDLPAGGTALTYTWRPGEVIADTHVITLPAKGDFQILIGLYDPVTGERLPAYDEVLQPLPNAAVPLERFTVS